MIKLILQGGLGNQMFEYATAYALAKDRHASLVLDTSFFDVFGKRSWCRPYELSVFDLHTSAAFSHNQHIAVRVLPHLRKWCRAHNTRYIGRYVFEMKTPQAVPSYRSLVLFDYFADYRLFESARTELLKAFTFKDQPNASNAALLQEMNLCESVAVHIRRGDYMSEAYKNIFFHPSVQWYRKAMDEIKKSVPKPTYYFFSDDIQWVKEQFAEVKNAVFVDVNHGKDSYNDMRLMSACKHNIIANSSFSWWAAWLNKNPKKLIIAPSKYYMDVTRAEEYRKKMIPKGWITIECEIC